MKALQKSIIIFLAAALMFTGCTGMTEKSVEKQTYTVTGSINFAGAQTGSADRTAVVSFKNVTWDVVAYPYSGTNYDSTSPTYATINGDRFTLSLSEGNYCIEVYNQGPKEEAYLFGTKDVTVSSTSTSEIEITVAPVTVSSSTGDVELTFYAADSIDIYSVTAAWEVPAINEQLEGANSLTAYFSGGEDSNATLTMNDIPAGVYTVTFKFANSEDKVLYSCREIINVLPYAVTNTWVGNSPYITSEGKFLLTQDILNSFGKIAPDYSPTNTPYILYSKNTEKNGITSQKGMQIFDTIDSSSTITQRSEGFADFCFSDDSIWALFIPKNGPVDDCSAATLRKYKQTYSGSYIAKDYSIENLIHNCTLEIEIDDGNGNPIPFNYQSYDEIGSITKTLSYYDGILYFVCKLVFSGNEKWFIFGFNPETEAIEQYYIKDNDDFNCVYAEHFLLNDGIFYYSMANNINKIDYRIEGNELRFVYDTLHQSVLNSKDLGFFIKEYYYPQVSDLQIIDNTLYVLVYAYAEEQTYYASDGLGGYTKFLSACVSNGGVMKFDISDKNADIALSDWDNGEKILGWYLAPDSAGKTYYSDNYSGSTIETDNLPLVTQPPLDQTDEIYFFGARKFVAKKPDELVIADDGGYITSAVNKTGIGKSRVVTVNLEDESMSAIDVGVTYSTKTDPTATAYYFCDD